MVSFEIDFQGQYLYDFFFHLVSTYSDPLRSKKYSKVHACTTLVMVAFIYKSPAADRCT